MSQNSNKPLPKFKPPEEGLLSSPKEVQLLERELKLLKSEMNTLRNQKNQPPKVKKEVKKLESTIGEVLLDLAEEIPFAGKAIKWFRNWLDK